MPASRNGETAAHRRELVEASAKRAFGSRDGALGIDPDCMPLCSQLADRMRKSFKGANDLRYRAHTDFHSKIYGKPLDRDGLNDALDDHLISVVQALFDESSNIMISSAKLRSAPAQEYAIAGLANRLTCFGNP